MLAQNLQNIQQNAFPAAWGANPRYTIGNWISDSKILDYVFGAAAIILLIYLILGGLQMMTSKGDPKAMQGAQAKITNAILGFVIIFIAFWIVQIFGKILGITVFADIFS